MSAYDVSRRSGGGVVSFSTSLLYVIEGARFLRSHTALWKYAAAPMVISALILGGSYILLYSLYTRFAAPWQGAEWYGRVLYYVLLVVLGAGVLVVFFFLFTRLASAVAAPFNDLLSQKTEHLVTGREDELPFSVVQLLKDSVRSLGHSFKILAIYLALALVALLLLFIPGVGGFLYAVGGTFISAYMFAHEYLGYPMDRRRFSWEQKRAFLRSRLREALGFGLGNVAVASIPFINIFFIPAAVVGGTLLFLDLNASRQTDVSS